MSKQRLNEIAAKWYKYIDEHDNLYGHDIPAVKSNKSRNPQTSVIPATPKEKVVYIIRCNVCCQLGDAGSGAAKICDACRKLKS